MTPLRVLDCVRAGREGQGSAARPRAGWLVGAALLLAGGACTDRIKVGANELSAVDDRDRPLPAVTGGSGGGASGTGGTTPAVIPDPCAALRCGPGVCGTDPDTRMPRCYCPEGFLDGGGRCMSCPIAVGNRVEKILPATEIRVNLSVNGGPTQSGAIIRLRDAATGLVVPFDANHPTGSRLVPHGVYQIFYSGLIVPPYDAPANQDLPVGTVVIDGAVPGPRTIDIPLQATRVSGRADFGLTHDTMTRHLHLALQTGDSLAPLRYADPARLTIEALVVPGAYAVGVVGNDPHPVVVALSSVEVPHDSLTFPLDVTVPVGQIDVDLRIRGKLPEFSALLYLHSELGAFALDRVDGASYRAFVPHGSYVLTYAPLFGTDVDHPLQIFGPPLRRLEVRGPQALAVDLDLVKVAGLVTVAGKVPDQSAQRILLRSNDLGSVALRLSGAGAFSEWVMPGSYFLQYECADPRCRDGVNWPANRTALFGVQDIKADSNVNLDVPSSEVEITVAENGVPGRGAIGLDGDALSPSVWGGSAYVEGAAPTLRAQIVPSAYLVSYRRDGMGHLSWKLGRLPGDAFRPTFSVKLTYDLKLVRATGLINLGNPADWPRVRFENPDNGFVALDLAPDGSFSADLPPGSYLLKTDNGPLAAVLGCYTFVAP